MRLLLSGPVVHDLAEPPVGCCLARPRHDRAHLGTAAQECWCVRVCSHCMC